VTSTEAPEKRPDVTTEKGIKDARKPLDAIHKEFVKEIAKGRETTADEVNENYGRGAIVIAADAIKKGMIDKIGISNFKQPIKETASDGGEEVSMKTLAEFKAAHPALYIEAVAVGKAEGKAETMDLVQTHAHWGRESGALEMALDAIEKGTPMTGLIEAKYKTATIKKTQLDAREDENPPDFDGGVGDDDKDKGDPITVAAWNILDKKTDNPDVMDMDALDAPGKVV